MLIQGTVDIQDINPHHGAGQRRGRPLKSYILTKKVNGCYYLCVKNSMYPNCINYKMSDLDKMFTKCLNERKFGLQFKHPNHLVLIVADDLNMLKMFHRQLQDIIDGKNVNISKRLMPKTFSTKNVINKFDPKSTQFIAIDGFDRRILNMTNLSRLYLNDCIISTLPEQLGHLPITYFSISGCKLPTSSAYDRDTLWNWTSKDTICKTLTTLKMDSIELNKLPFEILFLTNLDTLSVAKNKLTYLPHYIGELRKLLYLNIADNQIPYFPDSLFSRTFNDLDISNNNFPFSQIFLEYSKIPDHIQNYRMLNKKTTEITRHANDSDEYGPSTLNDLSFIALFQSRRKFKRQEMPRVHWHLYDVIGRCVSCSKYSLPDCNIFYAVSIPRAINLTRTDNETTIQWLSLTCSRC